MRTRCAALLLLAATAHATPLTRLRAKLVPKPKQSIALDATDGPSPRSLRRDNAAAVATVEALIDDKDPRCKLSAEEVACRLEEDGEDESYAAQPWAALPWKVPEDWPAPLPPAS